MSGRGGASLALPRVLSAIFYGICSFFIVLVNKGLLSAYRFPSPSFLGIGQLFPLPLTYVGNHISELSSTSKLSLLMFTVLRKFTIPLTLLLEVIIHGKHYPLNIFISVFAIVLGAFIAAGSDLSFNLEDYTFVLLNYIFTAANGIYTKQKMDPKESGKYGVLSYNACFMMVPMIIISFSTGDFQQRISSNGQIFYLSSSFFFPASWGFFCCILLSYAVVNNSALTMAVVDAIKNISIAYIRMLIGGDYTFSVLNFIGLNICMAGGLRYSFLTLRGNSKPAQPEDEENVLPESKC